MGHLEVVKALIAAGADARFTPPAGEICRNPDNVEHCYKVGRLIGRAANGGG